MDYKLPLLILFDLDGTLVDSAPDLARSVDHTLRTLNLPSFDEATIRTWVGNGAARLIKRVLTGSMDGEPEAVLFNRAQHAFMQHYRGHVCVHSRLYPCVADTLIALSSAGHVLGCVTNKPAEFTRPLLQALSIDHQFSIVLSGDDLPRKKPDPLPITHAAESLGTSLDAVIMVGDSRNDINAAKAAGVISVAVPYGYNHGEDIALSAPDYLIADLSALIDILQHLSPQH